MHSFTYSPYSIEQYMLPGLNKRCEAGAISDLKRSASVWNMFWLSTPGIDQVPGSGKGIYKLYMPTPNAAASITADVCLDDVLHAKLSMHPSRFVAWFEREDHSIYDVYEILGERQWVDTVLK